MPDPPIVVIGGGPAGSCVSTLLARRGYPVTLLERERFPRDHVGESLLPASIPILEDLGVLERVQQAGFVLKRGATMIWGVDRQPWSWYFSETNASNPHSYQVWRPEFDAILLDNARRSGVHVREGCAATEVVLDDAQTAVAVRCGDETLPARYTSSTPAARVACCRASWACGSGTISSATWRCTRTTRAADRLQAPDEGNILIESQSNGWMWNIPLRDGWSSVGAVVDSETGQEGIRRLGARGFLDAQVAAAPQTAKMLENARLVSGPEIVRDWSYRCRSTPRAGVHPGW